MNQLRTARPTRDLVTEDEARDDPDQDDTPSIWEETVKAIAEAVAEGRRRPH